MENKPNWERVDAAGNPDMNGNRYCLALSRVLVIDIEPALVKAGEPLGYRADLVGIGSVFLCRGFDLAKVQRAAVAAARKMLRDMAAKKVAKP